MKRVFIRRSAVTTNGLTIKGYNMVFLSEGLEFHSFFHEDELRTLAVEIDKFLSKGLGDEGFYVN